jgi:PAS domain S-box-containing protein
VGTKGQNRAGSFAPMMHWDIPASHGHSVQFYEDDSFLVEGLSRFIGAAILAGDSAIVIATRAHRDALSEHLASKGLDLEAAIRQGRFLSLDAAETLGQFMVNGQPSASRFHATVGSLIRQLSGGVQGEQRRIAAFGEMVALLWAEGKPDAALELERLWNGLSETHTFQLHCAYPMSLFSQAGDAADMEKICREHSSVAPAEGYTALHTDEERLRAIAVLQQKAQALESEIREREQVQQILQKRDAELTDFIENAVIAMHWVAADGRILWANQSELSLLGCRYQECVGHHIAEFHADSNVIEDILQRLARHEELHGYKARLRCRNGSIRHVLIHSNVFTEEGKFVHTRCFTIDVTETHRSEQRMAAQHRITRLLSEADSLAEVTESILEAICDSSECDMGSLWVVEKENLRCVKTWRRSATRFPEFEKATSVGLLKKGEGLPGRIWLENEPVWIEDISADHSLPRRFIALREGIHSAFGFPIGTNKGPVGVIEFVARESTKADDDFMKMMASVGNQIGQFIERKQAEQALRESEARLRLAQQAAGIGSFELDLQTNVNRWTPELEAMYGLSPGGFAGTQKAWEQLIHPEDRVRMVQQVETTFQTSAPVQAEWRVIWPDGSIHSLFGRWQVFRDESGTPVRMTGVNLDITQRKEMEEAQRRLAAIVESSDDAIASKDLNGIVTSWNKSAEKLFGYRADEMIGQPITLIIPPELQKDEEMILGKIRSGEKIDHFETVRLTRKGDRIEVSLTISPVKDGYGLVIGAAKIARDITESKKVERALRTTEKLAAAGRLAATVAHEINNPLEAVTNLVYLARRDITNPEKAVEYLEFAGRELDRVAHIARQTLGFYRDPSAPKLMNVGATLDDVLLLYETRLETRGIKVVKQYGNDIEITALSGEIRQALSNLITNAADAMPFGGSLVIRASKSHEWNNSCLPGVRIMILDTGSGIAAEHRKKLFQPFFTTKEDVGTGLGLWITYNIVTKHGGVIHVKSRTGEQEHGTVFSIFLPFPADTGKTKSALASDSRQRGVTS